jgi:hypothetical protein
LAGVNGRVRGGIDRRGHRDVERDTGLNSIRRKRNGLKKEKNLTCTLHITGDIFGAERICAIHRLGECDRDSYCGFDDSILVGV